MAEQDSTAQEGVENETENTEPATDENAEVTETEDETDAEGSGAEGDEQEQPEEEIEFDFGGNKFRAPKTAIPENIASELDKFSKGIWSDYSRGKGELAEQRKSLEAERTAVQKIQQLDGEALNTYARGLAVRQELEQLAKVNLTALWQSQNQEDRDRARLISDTISAKQAELNGIVNRVSQLEAESSKEQQAQASRRMDEGKAVVAKHIPDFETKVLPELSEYVIKHGIPKEEVGNWPMNPTFTMFAHKAMLYDKMQAKAQQAAKPKPAPAQPIMPLATRPGPKPNLDLVRDADKMSPEEWVRRRNAQVSKRAG
jgi:hypothetical protein